MMPAVPNTRSVDHIKVFERSSSYRLTCIALTIWWLAFLYPLIATRSVEDDLQLGADQSAQATSEGSLTNQIIVVSFAVLGIVHLPHALRVLRKRREMIWPVCALAVYVLWATASLFWSDDIALTIRRLGIMILSFVGVIGLGAGFYSRTSEPALRVARHVMYASWVALIVLFVSRFQSTDLTDLFRPEFVLRNTTTLPYMFPLAYGIVAALVLRWSGKIKQIVSLSLFVIVLLLLRGRTQLANTAAVGLLTLSRLIKTGPTRVVCAVIGAVFSAQQIDLATGGWIFRYCVNFLADSSSRLLYYVSRGRGLDDLLSLDGRVPLWQALWPYIYERPLIGYGFGAFWRQDRFYAISLKINWVAPTAHNGSLEEMLGTGVVGLALLLVFWFSTMRATLRVTGKEKRERYLVCGWLLLFLFFYLTGAVELSSFATPLLFSLTALFALLGERIDNSSRRSVSRIDPSFSQELRNYATQQTYGKTILHGSWADPV